MLFESISKKIFLTLMTLGMTASCSGAKFAGGSGKGSGATTGQPTEQPTDVAGGFGLTCRSADNPSDPLQTDFTCTFVNSSGLKFQETADQKVDLQVQINEKSVAFNPKDPVSSSSFTFTVLKSEITSVKIAARVINPQDGGKVKGELNKGLPDVIDTTPPSAPNVTGTSTPTANTTPTWTWSSGGGGGNSVYRYKLNDSDLSTGATRITATTWTPSAALSEATHTLYVQERDAAGNWSTSGSFPIQVVAPLAAPTLSTPIRYQTSLSLSWASVSGTSYNLYWSNSSGVNESSTKIASVTSVYNHSALTPGATYYYRLAAVKNGLESALSSEVSATTYTSAAPTVISISPNSGPLTGGTTVTITGTGFQSGVTVSIGGIPATNVIRVTQSSITATTPSGSSGAKNVVVTNLDTQTGTLNSGFTYTSSSSCSPNPNDCYEGAQDLPLSPKQTRQGPGGLTIELVESNGPGSFKVWKEENGNRILNATGKLSNGWQRNLESNGLGFKTMTSNAANDPGYMTVYSSITGRACPTYVYVGGTAKENTCLYYTTESHTGTLDMPANSDPSTQGGGNVTWHEANLSICSSKGMRLPTAYEVGATQIETYDFMPSAVVPETPSTNDTERKVPLITSSVGIWTATGSKRDINNYFALVTATTQTTSTPYRICANSLNPNERCLMDFPKSDTRFGIRCVVPGF